MPQTESDIREEQFRIEREISDNNAYFKDSQLLNKDWVERHSPDAIIKVMEIIEKVQRRNLKLMGGIRDTSEDDIKDVNDKLRTLMDTFKKNHALKEVLLKKNKDLEQELQKQRKLTQLLDENQITQRKDVVECVKRIKGLEKAGKHNEVKQSTVNDEVWKILTDLRQRSGQYVPRSQRSTPSKSSNSTGKLKKKKKTKMKKKKKMKKQKKKKTKNKK